MRLAVLYLLFAGVATVANIGAQEAAIRVYDDRFGVPVSVFVGTGVGLVVKYLLDKAFIFDFRARDARHDAQTFVLYTAMGLVTTAIFWGFEFAFDAIFRTKDMRYLGGVIGLGLGYWIKYRLDKRFVFRASLP